MRKRIVFLSGTRADFGKLKSLIDITRSFTEFDVHIFATGMHMHHKYGYTVNEIIKCGFDNIYKFINFTSEETMDLTLAKTIDGFSSYLKENKADLIVIHGDRVEALAGAIVGALNNILVAHIEGGEISGTVDELIRHAVSKLSHIHFVANPQAKHRLIQMGELESSIFIIGSPDVDIMLSDDLPSLEDVKQYYEIDFAQYALALFHPITTEVDSIAEYARHFTRALLEDDSNYVIVYPNNDLGSSEILRCYEAFKRNSRFRIFPSIRFEYFLVLMKHAQLVIGNSSAGIREAPYYGTPTVNIGTRQNNRALSPEIINCGYSFDEISKALAQAKRSGRFAAHGAFGAGESNLKFKQIVASTAFWSTSKQKCFNDIRPTLVERI